MTRGSRKRSLYAASDLRSNHPQLGRLPQPISAVGAEARNLSAGVGVGASGSHGRIPIEKTTEPPALAPDPISEPPTGLRDTVVLGEACEGSPGARAIRAEVQQAQDALHVAVDGLLAEAREKGHLVAIVRSLLARVTR